MTPTVVEALPAQVARILEDFCAAGKHGSLTLEIKQGRVTQWKLTESGHIDSVRRPS